VTVYATVADLRAEGVTPTNASDARLQTLLAEAGTFVDSVTGWFFEPRALTLRMDGRGHSSIEPALPPVRLDALAIEHEGALSVALEDLVVEGSPVGAGFLGPRLTLRHGRRFPKGVANVTAAGLWGYTEPDGTPTGRTPAPIRTVTMQLVLRALPLLSNEEAWESARRRWRLVEERTRDQSYRLNPATFSTFLTGDPDIDLVLLRYRRPHGLGAA
jgi:hypothetical protein